MEPLGINHDLAAARVDYRGMASDYAAQVPTL